MEELLGEVRLERSLHASRLGKHVLAQLACLGAHTITGLLSVCGLQFRDWSADYRMYGRERVDPDRLFEVVRRRLCAMQDGPVVVALDDTQVKKTGRKVHGARYTRDPMGPPFHVNFIRAQRFLQVSMALKGHEGSARMLPVDWVHAPVPAKPGKTARAEERALYREESARARISRVGVERINRLRTWMNENGAAHRRLWSVGDGSFTNGTVLKNLPPNTTFVGRIRSDAKLHHLPDQQAPKGRHRVYGDKAPTPEELRQDDTQPWEEVEVFFGGEKRVLRAKRLTPLRWRTAGQQHDLQLLVIAPTAYHLSPQSRKLYRNPAYLICTDPDASLKEIVQHYLWRWDIETNFRDEKSLMGVGQAGARTPAATQNVTATAVAAYSMLLLAAELCSRRGLPPQHLPAPKWQRKPSRRATTMNLIQNLRHELWAQAIHFSDFVNSSPQKTKPQKHQLSLSSALFYANASG